MALVVGEPLGPPFLGAPGMPLTWGVANAPLAYNPPVTGPAELTVTVEESGPVPRALQAEPARQLARLAQTPIVLVTGEASLFRGLDEHTRAFLEQAGCKVDHVRLWEHGVHGNAHGFMLELNHTDVLELILQRVRAATAATTAGALR